MAETDQTPPPDRSEPSEERKAELRAAYQEGSDTPYHGVRIRTLGELAWICTERDWSGEWKLPAGKTRPNLRVADLSYATLSGADLRWAKLDKANLHGATMSGANLSYAKLDKADLIKATMSGANLTRAFFTADTNVDGVVFTDPPRCLGVRWNGVPLDEVDWAQAPRLGDEQAITKGTTRAERVHAYRNAARAYHGLVVALETQGLTEPARRFRQRERALERRALRVRPQTWGGYLFYALLNLISGQGEAPERIFAAYAVIISFFTGIYWEVSQRFPTSSQPLHWYEALVLSLSSFHGRGFFPAQIGLGDPLAIIASIEAVMGLFIELILIATFSNRFLNK